MKASVRTGVVVAEGHRFGGARVLGRRGEAGEGEGEAEAGAGGAAEGGAVADEVLHVQLQLRAPRLADVAVAAAAAASALLPPEAGLARLARRRFHVAQHRLRRRRAAQRLQRRQLLRLGPLVMLIDASPSPSAAAARAVPHRRLLHYRFHRNLLATPYQATCVRTATQL